MADPATSARHAAGSTDQPRALPEFAARGRGHARRLSLSDSAAAAVRRTARVVSHIFLHSPVASGSTEAPTPLSEVAASATRSAPELLSSMRRSRLCDRREPASLEEWQLELVRLDRFSTVDAEMQRRSSIYAAAMEFANPNQYRPGTEEHRLAVAQVARHRESAFNPDLRVFGAYLDEVWQRRKDVPEQYLYDFDAALVKQLTTWKKVWNRDDWNCLLFERAEQLRHGSHTLTAALIDSYLEGTRSPEPDSPHPFQIVGGDRYFCEELLIDIMSRQPGHEEWMDGLCGHVDRVDSLEEMQMLKHLQELFRDRLPNSLSDAPVGTIPKPTLYMLSQLNRSAIEHGLQREETEEAAVAFSFILTRVIGPNLIYRLGPRAAALAEVFPKLLLGRTDGEGLTGTILSNESIRFHMETSALALKRAIDQPPTA